jgi:hypothetical protein
MSDAVARKNRLLACKVTPRLSIFLTVNYFTLSTDFLNDAAEAVLAPERSDDRHESRTNGVSRGEV